MPFGTSSATHNLLNFGADKDTINVYDRKINSPSGAVGSGYISKSDSTLFAAGFYVSPKSLCWIYLKDNQTEMISALKTIHVTEAAYGRIKVKAFLIDIPILASVLLAFSPSSNRPTCSHSYL